MRQRKLRLQLERGAERRLGLGHLAQLFLQAAQVQIGRSRVGLQLDRDVVMRPALVEPPFVLQGPPQRQMRLHAIGVERDNALPARNRIGRLFQLVVQLGQPLPEFGVARARARPPSSARPPLRRPDPSAATPRRDGRWTAAGWGSSAGPRGKKPGRRRTAPAPAARCPGCGARPPSWGRGAPPLDCAAAPPRPCRDRAGSGPGWSGRGQTCGSSSTALRKCSSATSLLASLAQGDAQVVMGHREVRPQFQGLAQLRRPILRTSPRPCKAAPRLHSASG